MLDPLGLSAGRVLASCSDDTTAKLWTVAQAACLHDLTLHTKEVYTLKWSPQGGQGGSPALLATASFDFSIRCSPQGAGQGGIQPKVMGKEGQVKHAAAQEHGLHGGAAGFPCSVRQATTMRQFMWQPDLMRVAQVLDAGVRRMR